MGDKERILMMIVTRVITRLMYSTFNDRDKIVKSHMFEQLELLKRGDLVFTTTTIVPNDFMVGFVEEVDKENQCVVIREIGSKKLCRYYNEWFTVINKKEIGYEYLEGVQYKTYIKVLKAFSKYAEYGTKFKSISFEGNVCTIQSRQMHSNDLENEWSFKYDSKTTIKSIGEIISK
jgi:hypothetical protein